MTVDRLDDGDDIGGAEPGPHSGTVPALRERHRWVIDGTNLPL